MATDASSTANIPFSSGSAARSSSPALRRRLVLFALGLLPSLLTLWRGGNQFVYLVSAAIILLAACFCCLAARRFPMERMRWLTLAGSEVMGAAAYVAPALHDYGVLSANHAAWAVNFTAAACHMLFIPALMGMRAKRGNLVRALDVLLVAIGSITLMFAFGSGPSADSGAGRTWTSLLTIVTLVVLAYCATLIDSSAGMRRFTNIAFRYLLATFACTLLGNVVGDILHIPESILNAAIPLADLLLIDWILQRRVPTLRRWTRLDHAVVDSMQPSVLTLGSVMLALFAFRAHLLIAGTMVVGLVLLYVTRTQVFYSRLFQEQVRLRSEATAYRQLATRDPLTGIGNRRWFETNAQSMVTDPNCYPCALLLVDTDCFKEINDTHGHRTGDEVLCLVADVLQRANQTNHDVCIARIGGDEFAVVLPRRSKREAARIGERIRSGVQELGAARNLKVSVSVGGACAQVTTPLGDLLHASDQALYAVKDGGRNAVRIFCLCSQECSLAA